MASLFSEPHLLRDYKNAPTRRGIYIIGRVKDVNGEVRLSDSYCNYFWNCPENLDLLYVGNSLAKTGVRNRLSAHARGCGNQEIHHLLMSGVQLYYVTHTSDDESAAEKEAVFLALKSEKVFPLNVREEHERSANRQARKIRAEMSQRQRDYYDGLDMGESGSGM